MESTAMSLAKATLDVAIGRAKSMVAEGIANPIGVQRDLAVLLSDLEMMQSYLMSTAEEQRYTIDWLRLASKLAYNVEDELEDLAVRLETEKTSGRWRIPRILCDRREVAHKLKNLLAEVASAAREGNSKMQSLIDKGSSGAEQPSGIFSAISAIDEASSTVDLRHLITDDPRLRVLTVLVVWGTSCDLDRVSGFKEFFEHATQFECRAWVNLGCPFDRDGFLRDLTTQLGVYPAQAAAGRIQNSHGEIQDLIVYLHVKRCLIVIQGLRSTVEWDWIRTCFPDWGTGSTVVVSTQQVEIASLCAEKPYQVSQLRQLTPDQDFFLFHKKVYPSTSDTHLYSMMEYEGSHLPEWMAQNQLKANPGIDSSLFTLPDDGRIFGRDEEISQLMSLIVGRDNYEHCNVVTVCGVGGVGKTTVVRRVYESGYLARFFMKRAWVTVMRPFNLEVLLRSLARQLHADPTGASASGGQKKQVDMLGVPELINLLNELFEKMRCLIVLDDLSCTQEWDLIHTCLENAKQIVVTTGEEGVAEHIRSIHCSKGGEGRTLQITSLGDADAFRFFQRKVFKDDIGGSMCPPEMRAQACLIVKRCSGIPLALSMVSGFLSDKPKTAGEWEKFNNYLNSELDTMKGVGMIKSILVKIYDGLQYNLKHCMMYMSIFTEDHKIRGKRLVKRWIAESYSREILPMSAEEIGKKYYVELIHRNMIQPVQRATRETQKSDCCQLHDLIRDICISKSGEENLVFTMDHLLDEGGSSWPQGTIRHLAISSSWRRNQIIFEALPESMLHIRSLTVFGEWRWFLISEKMKFLRVLDLEDTTCGVKDGELDKIGQLLHLRYLSLRGCSGIFHLPDSLGNLRQLETLDVKGTSIRELPTTIGNLGKLKCILSGPTEGYWSRADMPQQPKNTFLQSSFGSAWYGVNLPIGIGRLKALNVLVAVNVARTSKAALKELKELGQLRKLQVTFLDGRSIKMFWSAIASHSGLKSLSAYTCGDELFNVHLGESYMPPNCLESLKLKGQLANGVRWISKFENLVKLQIQESKLYGENDLQVFGELPNLKILRLLSNSVMAEKLKFHLGSFNTLRVLELTELFHLQLMRFQGGAMRRLEMIQLVDCGKLEKISGLRFLYSLREVRLGGEVSNNQLKEMVREQFRRNPNKPRLKEL